MNRYDIATEKVQYKNRLLGVTVTCGRPDTDDVIEVRGQHKHTAIKMPKLGGRWDKDNKCWLLPANQLDNVLSWFKITKEEK